MQNLQKLDFVGSLKRKAKSFPPPLQLLQLQDADN